MLSINLFIRQALAKIKCFNFQKIDYNTNALFFRAEKLGDSFNEKTQSPCTCG